MEIWKDVLDYEQQYQVSNLGNIRSKDHEVRCKGGKTRMVKGKLRMPQTNRKGYQIAVLSKDNQLKTFTVHQLVARAFIPDFVKGTELNHIDGDKTNNCVSNLEVSDPSHNQIHAVKTGLVPKVGKSKYRNVCYMNNPKAVRKWAACISVEGKSFGKKSFMTEEEAARHADYLLDLVGDTQRLRNFPATP